MSTRTKQTDAEAAAALGRPDASQLTTRELADLLQLREQTPRRWRHEGTGPVYLRIGGRVRYRPSDVATWLEDRRREHPAKAAGKES